MFDLKGFLLNSTPVRLLEDSDFFNQGVRASAVSWHCNFLILDGEELDKDLEDLIDDNPIEDDGSESSGSDGEGGEKRKHDDSDLEEDLSDEDYDLIKENLGIEVKRKVSISIQSIVETLWSRRTLQMTKYTCIPALKNLPPFQWELVLALT